jgi:hypothetical protein
MHPLVTEDCKPHSYDGTGACVPWTHPPTRPVKAPPVYLETLEAIITEGFELDPVYTRDDEYFKAKLWHIALYGGKMAVPPETTKRYAHGHMNRR